MYARVYLQLTIKPFEFARVCEFWLDSHRIIVIHEPIEYPLITSFICLMTAHALKLAAVSTVLDVKAVPGVPVVQGGC